MTSIEPMGPATPAVNEYFETLCEEVAKYPTPPQVRTEHHLHAGMYTRTLYVPAGCVAVGLKLKIETQLICAGHFQITDGTTTREFKGYHVLEGLAGRRAAAYAITDSAFSMCFPTKAKTVDEAEAEFTDEPERLLTRKEKKCQEQLSLEL
jgi:hypothetical protein|nr:MAG TPA: hypothetical protein [Caudoviricetes sp.]